MNTVRYEPWHLLSDFNNLFDNMLQRRSGDNSYVETGNWIPAVDIKEELNQFILLADLPGVDKDNIEIAMEDNILTIKGERSEERKEEKDNYSRIERIKGSFYRRFTLPDTAKSEQINAKFCNGVLKIIIPKKEKAQPKRITIQAEE